MATSMMVVTSATVLMPNLDSGAKLVMSSALILAVTNILMPAALMVAVAKVLATMPRLEVPPDSEMTLRAVPVPSAVVPGSCELHLARR